MAISSELMTINMKINGLTHQIINFKKQKVMDYFKKFLIYGILRAFDSF